MKQKINHSSMNNGLIVGLLLSVKFLISQAGNAVLTYIALALSVYILFYLFSSAIKFRNNILNGSITYGQSFKYVFFSYFLGTIVSSLVILIYYLFINTNSLNNQFTELLNLYQKLGINFGKEEEATLKIIFTPAVFAFFNVFSGAFTGSFWALIFGAFIKKNETIL